MNNNQIELLRGIIAHIEDNLAVPQNIDSVARRAGYTKWHLQRLFKELAGMSLGSYIRRRRLTEVALSLHGRKEVMIKFFIERYGYVYTPSFNRMFRDQFGMNPTECRAGSAVDASCCQFRIHIGEAGNVNHAANA